MRKHSIKGIAFGVLLAMVLVITTLLGCVAGDSWQEDFYLTDLFLAGDFQSQNIYPATTDTYDIGSPTLQYDNIYANSANVTSFAIGGQAIFAPSYGEFYITTSIATTCPLADTYYKVSGTTTADEIQGFTHSNGRLTYTGTGTRIFLVSVAISVSSDTNNVVLSTQVYINGVAHTASLIQRKIATAGDVGAQAIVTLLTLTTDDYIEIYIASDKAGVNITFNCMSLIATTVN